MWSTPAVPAPIMPPWTVGGLLGRLDHAWQRVGELEKVRPWKGPDTVSLPRWRVKRVAKPPLCSDGAAQYSTRYSMIHPFAPTHDSVRRA
jgi:hypothetical protein